MSSMPNDFIVNNYFTNNTAKSTIASAGLYVWGVVAPSDNFPVVNGVTAGIGDICIFNGTIFDKLIKYQDTKPIINILAINGVISSIPLSYIKNNNNSWEILSSPELINVLQKYVSVNAGNDAYNGQVDRKKKTIESALVALAGQSSGAVECEDGTYPEALTFGTTRSRISIRGSVGSEIVILNRLITFNQACQQVGLYNLKLENTLGGFGVDISSTLSNFVFNRLTCGGNHTNPILINVQSGGSGFIAISECDVSNKILKLHNSVTSRFCFISNTANLTVDAGTGWIVIKTNCTNVIEISKNNNILEGFIANSVLETDANYNTIVSAGAVANGYYLSNFVRKKTIASVDIVTNRLTITAHGLSTGDLISFIGTLPAPIVINTKYIVIKVSNDVISLLDILTNLPTDITTNVAGGEAVVFESGDVILRNNPNTVISNQHYNANNTYYNISDQKTYNKALGKWAVIGGGGFSVIADTTTTTLNLNTVTTTGITNYSALTSLTNSPIGIVPIVGKLITVENYYATNGIEQNLLLNDNKYFRSYINNVWSAWQLIATVDTTPNSNIIDGLATPPASPSNGDAYIMLASPTGAWSTFAQGTIATYNESTVSWVNTIPANGMAITFSNPVNLNSINSYYIAGQTYKYNSAWGSPVIAGLLWQLFISSSQFQPYDSQSISLVLASNIVTATCPQNHNLAVGYSVIISASPNALFNETVIVTTIVSPLIFRYAKTLANTTTTGTLKATTQLLPSGCTSALIPSTISFNVIIAVAAGSYSNGSSFICTNLRSAPCYVAGIPIGKLESMVLLPNATAQWQSADKKYEILNITAHGFTNVLDRNKFIVKLQTGNTYVFTDGADENKVLYGKMILNVIDTDRILVGNGEKITTFTDHGFITDISYTYGNPTNGGIGNMVDGETLTTGNRATIPLLSVIDNRTLDFSPKSSFISVNPVLVQTQIDSATKRYVLTDGARTNDVNENNNIITGVSSNQLTFSGGTKTVYGKFAGEIEELISTNITKLASQIPVFNATNPTLSIVGVGNNINSAAVGDYIIAINKAKTNGDGIFAIPVANFTDAVNSVATSITSGKIGFQLNPVVGYRHNGTVLEQYDFINMGLVNWNGTNFTSVINYALNRKMLYIGTSPLSFSITVNHNLGTKYYTASEPSLLCVSALAGFTVGSTYPCLANRVVSGVSDYTMPAISNKKSNNCLFSYDTYLSIMSNGGIFSTFVNGNSSFAPVLFIEGNY